MTRTRRPLPDRLVTDLTAQRTLALRNRLAQHPDVAFVAVLHALVLQTFYRHAGDSCLEISVRSAGFPQAQGLAETVWAKEIAERREDWGRDLPKDTGDLWPFLMTLDDASCSALFAHCAALSVNAVLEPWNKRPRALAHADQLAGAIGCAMAEAGWEPTVESYLGRVTKARILQAVREAKGAQSVQLIDHLKKADMAREAARLLQGSGWLPEPLRLPDDVMSANEQTPVEGAAPDDGADLPAFLADDDEEAVAAGERPTTGCRRPNSSPRTHPPGPGRRAGPFSFRHGDTHVREHHLRPRPARQPHPLFGWHPEAAVALQQEGRGVGAPRQDRPAGQERSAPRTGKLVGAHHHYAAREQLRDQWHHPRHRDAHPFRHQGPDLQGDRTTCHRDGVCAPASRRKCRAAAPRREPRGRRTLAGEESARPYLPPPRSPRSSRR